MRDEFKSLSNWSKRFLPHYDAANKLQVITYRLADSLPQSVNSQFQNLDNIQYRKGVDDCLDKGYGACLLTKEYNAQIVVDAWKFFDEQRYDLIAYVVMPNHVHLLIKVFNDWPLAKVIHSWKSYTAHEISKYESFNGHLWQREYWDRFIRDENHFAKVVQYIHENPVKAGLVDNAEDWRWSSAYKQEIS